MSFSGRVSRESHLGGLLVDFEGRPPRLGARIRISGGKIIGRVDTVLGPVGSALIHIHPLYNGIDARASVGSPVEIAPRDKSRQGRPRGRHSSGNFRERGGPRKGSSRDKGGRSFRGNKGGGRGGDRGSGGKGGRSFRDNKGGGRGGRGQNQRKRGPRGENRGSNKSGRRRDSGKSGRGRRR
jgi:rRNA processing protein Gar1